MVSTAPCDTWKHVVTAFVVAIWSTAERGCHR
jgi:hypothetical protein